MTDRKISGLADGGALQGTDEFVVARAGANYRIPASAVTGSQPGGQGIYGDGSAGSVHYTVDTDLAASVYATDILIDAGVTVNMKDWAIYARGTLTNNGTIKNDGFDGSVPAGGAVNGSGYGYVISAVDGGTGGTNADGMPGQSWYNQGPQGGAGGAAGSFAGGDMFVGDPGLILARSSLRGGSLQSNIPYPGDSPTGDSAKYIFHTPYAATGSGSGGAGAGGVGGGGGTGGGVVLLVCRNIVNNGVIKSQGGAGADGTLDTVNAWAPNTSYNEGDVVHPITPNGHVYRAAAGGTSDAGEPTFPTDGGTVTDNDFDWQDIGAQGAGGGGPGAGGLVVGIFDTWDGDDPLVSAGTPGAGAGGGDDGAAGDDGIFLSICNLAA